MRAVGSWALVLSGVEHLEVTAAAAAAVEQGVHGWVVSMLLKVCLGGLEDCGHLADPKRMVQTDGRERTRSSVVEDLDAWSEVGLVQKSQVVFAALMHVRCLLEAPHLL